jgi:hypothetical protein
VLVYDPVELINVIAYYGPGLEAQRLASQGIPEDAERIFLLSSFRQKPENLEASQNAVAELRRERTLVDKFSLPQVRVWTFR